MSTLSRFINISIKVFFAAFVSIAFALPTTAVNAEKRYNSGAHISGGVKHYGHSYRNKANVHSNRKHYNRHKQYSGYKQNRNILNSRVNISGGVKHYGHSYRKKAYAHKNYHNKHNKRNYGYNGHRKHHKVIHNDNILRSGAYVSGHVNRYYNRKSYRNRSGVTINNREAAGFNNKNYNYEYRNKSYLNDGDIEYGVAVIHGEAKPTPPCPEGFNCGYRLYEDGTGPRIIVPGVDLEGLPPEDGLKGPRIIRVQ